MATREEKLASLDNMHSAAKELLASDRQKRKLPANVLAAVEQIADSSKFTQFRSRTDGSVLDSGNIGYALLLEVASRVSATPTSAPKKHWKWVAIGVAAAAAAAGAVFYLF